MRPTATTPPVPRRDLQAGAPPAPDHVPCERRTPGHRRWWAASEGPDTRQHDARHGTRDTIRRPLFSGGFRAMSPCAQGLRPNTLWCGAKGDSLPRGRATGSGVPSARGLFLTTGGGGDVRDPPTTDCWQTHRPANVPPPRGGGGIGHPPTHPPTQPTTVGKMSDHRQNALTSVFAADPKSPTMAYPTGEGGGGRLETHTPRNSDNPPPPRRVGRMHMTECTTHGACGPTGRTSQPPAAVGQGRWTRRCVTASRTQRRVCATALSPTPAAVQRRIRGHAPGHTHERTPTAECRARADGRRPGTEAVTRRATRATPQSTGHRHLRPGHGTCSARPRKAQWRRWPWCTSAVPSASAVRSTAVTPPPLPLKFPTQYCDAPPPPPPQHHHHKMVALKLQQFQYNRKEKRFFSASYVLCFLGQGTVAPPKGGGGGDTRLLLSMTPLHMGAG